MITYKNTVGLLFLFCAMSFDVFAVDKIVVARNCNNQPAINDRQFVSDFTDLRKLAIETNNKLCQSMLMIDSSRNDRVRTILVEYARLAKLLLQKDFSKTDFMAVEEQLSRYASDIRTLKTDVTEKNLHSMRTGNNNDFLAELFFSNTPQDKKSVLPSELDSKCVAINQGYADCKNALQDAARAFNAYKYAYDTYRYEGNEVQLDLLSSKWDEFFEKGRSQTLLDIIFTSFMHRNYYSQTKLVEPAATQYFLMRPQIVYEHVDEALKGNREKIGLAAEWIGINWWNLKIPLGISAVSVYSDYKNVPSVGHGLLFTVDNKYSFGVTKRQGQTGVFVTFDFLKYVQDKNEQLQQYKNNF